MRTYEFRRWSGYTDRTTAERVDFTPGGGLAFWVGDRLVLAVKALDWNDLRDVTDGRT